MIVDSVFVNAKAYLKGQIVDCCIATEEGKIVKIGKETHMPHFDQKIDLHNLLVLPGLIDEHVHLRDEGRAYKEDFTSGTAAAAAGGFTTVLDMPNNDPVTLNRKNLENRMFLAERRILVNVGFYSELPRTLPEVNQVAASGAVGFKVFMGSQVGGVNVDDDVALQAALKVVSETKLPLAVHAEDRQMIAAQESELKKAMKESPLDYLRAHNEACEVKAVRRILKLAHGTPLHLHLLHLSTGEALSEVAQARKDGASVTCEVTPNHLMLTNDAVIQVGGLAIMAPPLRDKTQVNALWRGIKDGVVDTLGSDHAPHSLEEKTAKSIWEVKPGIPGLEVTLPLMLTAVKKGRLDISQLVSLLSEKPAEIFGLTDCGVIAEGKAADLTIVDFSQFKIDAAKFHSKAKFSPYHGWAVWGRIAYTVVGGAVVFEDGAVAAKGGAGRVLRGGAA